MSNKEAAEKKSTGARLWWGIASIINGIGIIALTFWIVFLSQNLVKVIDTQIDQTNLLQRIDSVLGLTFKDRDTLKTDGDVREAKLDTILIELRKK